MQVVAGGNICIDCVMLAVNGEESNAEHTRRYRAGIERLGMGEPHVEDVESEGHFSWFDCNVCGDELGGQRMRVIWLG
jgi:hypothetical protein